MNKPLILIVTTIVSIIVLASVIAFSLPDKSTYYHFNGVGLNVIILNSHDSDIIDFLETCINNPLNINTINNINNFINNIERITDKTGGIVVILDLRNNNINPSEIADVVRISITNYTPVILIGNYETILTIVVREETGLAAFAVPKPLNSSSSFIVEAIVPVKYSFNGRVAAKFIANIGASMRDQICDTIKKVVIVLQKSRNYDIFAITPPSDEVPLLGELDVTYTSSSNYGKINVRDELYWPYNDGNSDYNWFLYVFDDQIIPGEALWGNGWRNADLIQQIDVDKYNYTNFLSEYDPSTYIGSSVYTVTVEIGLETGVDRDGASVGGSLTVGFSWSYEKPDIVIHDRSEL